MQIPHHGLDASKAQALSSKARALSHAVSQIELVNLDDPTGRGDFILRRFPRSIETHDKANWDALDVAGFVKPLTYLNTEPQTIEIPEAWIDKSDWDISVLSDIETLRSYMRRGAAGATPSTPAALRDEPPTLQLIIGDWTPAVVLVEMRAERTRFTGENVQTRAKLSLTFMVVQDSTARRPIYADSPLPAGGGAITA